MANFAVNENNKPDRKRLVLFVVGIIALVGAVVFAAWQGWKLVGDMQKHQAFMREANTQVQEYESKAYAVSTAPVANSRDISVDVSAADEAGKKLADAQTAFQDLGAGDSVAYIKNTISPFFTENAEGIERWCQDLTARYKWTCAKALSYENGKVPCLFKCTVGNDGELVAYATAEFDVKSGLFSNAKAELTSNAKKYIAAESESRTYDGGSNQGTQGEQAPSSEEA